MPYPPGGDGNLREKEPVLVAWSGGKDSALALFRCLRSPKYRVKGLLTTLTEPYDRVTMHGVRKSLLELQASSLRIPLIPVIISKHCTDDQYRARMKEVLQKEAEQGVSHVVFGDLFLEDVRAYRERHLAEVGMAGLFPLWGKDTAQLSRAFLRLGFRAVITCVDGQILPDHIAGEEFDGRLLSWLPKGVDPCGERGEFHTFVYDGPIFERPVAFRRGKVVTREGRFHYVDLLPPLRSDGDWCNIREGLEP